jgi:conjugal transfer/entry exclusion protein
MFLLWNKTDQVYASPEEFTTEGEAQAYAREFRKRFVTQGYYKTANGERISPDDVELVVERFEP